MTRMMFVNLPVADVAASRAFWEGLGFTFNDDYSDERAACMVVNDSACAMLLRQDYFHSFHGTTAPPSGDQVLVALTASDAAEVDCTVERALAAGGSPAGAKQEHPGMYGWSFRDLDGHVWELAAMGG